MQATRKNTSILFSFLLLAQLVASHGVIIGATGDQGGSGYALGVDTSTPRDGTRRRPFQQDTTRFQDEDEEEATTGCGETLQNGQINIPSAMAAVISDNGGLPLVSAGGTLTMTLHQVNADGAGPYRCMIDTTGTGAQFTNLQVTQNVPGERGRDRDGEASDFPLVVQMPANLQCTGTGPNGETGICMVRCQNPARAGPFGGCVPIQQIDPNAGAGAGAGAGGNAGNAGNAGNVNNGNVGNNAGNANNGQDTGLVGNGGATGNVGNQAPAGNNGVVNEVPNTGNLNGNAGNNGNLNAGTGAGIDNGAGTGIQNGAGTGVNTGVDTGAGTVNGNGNVPDGALGQVLNNNMRRGIPISRIMRRLVQL